MTNAREPRGKKPATKFSTAEVSG